MLKTFNNILRSSTIGWAIVWAVQAGVFAWSGVAAFLLRFDFSLPTNCIRSLGYALFVWICIKSVVFQIAKLNRRGLRYVSLVDLYRLTAANVAGSILSCAVILLITGGRFPRSIYLSDLILAFLGTTGLRVVARMTAEPMLAERSNTPKRRTFIYGAGDAGITLLREIRNNPKLAYRVVGFLDDDPNKRGMRISGIEVLSGGDNVRELTADHGVEIILIAIPSAGGTKMKRILEVCYAAGTPCKIVPGLEELIEEHGLANQIREVAVEDLLGRTPVWLDGASIRDTLEDKVVLVTGAAGSIGSELCRQIARFRPAGIVGFEIAESALFEIDREMHQMFPQVPFHAEIGNIQNRERLNEVLLRYMPSAVYHAAAYKHVPLMEEHVFEAIENNVFGTWNVAKAASDCGVHDFVLVSSDKAVRPTNVMGTTKRIAELMVMALQNGGTQYVAVRFGNVLGSNGSVIPIFRKQIATGGPVTVTHPEMRRYFMTIPEACQLVLQASALCSGGQICVLDMGQPVKIIDLARNLILLSGLKPDEEIKIEFTGIRPGEKLYEELSNDFEDSLPTSHEKVRILMGSGAPEIDFEEWLMSVRDICGRRDLGRLVLALKEIVRDYNPSVDLIQRIVQPQGVRTTALRHPRVIVET